MVSISVLMPTARDSYGTIIGLGDRHLFESTVKSLINQSFKDFEFVCVDSLFEKRPKTFEGEPFQGDRFIFPVKHIPVHANHRHWLDHRRWSVCGALNSAILMSEGELLVRVDDSSEFDPNYLQRVWDEYQKNGRFLLGMHTRFRNGKQAYYDEDYKRNGYDTNPQLRGARDSPEFVKEVFDKLFGGGKPVRDTRWDVVIQHGGRMVIPDDWPWFYGYSSFSMEAALRVNGLDESFDGRKGQEDQDLGNRLVMAGYRGCFVLDVNHWVIEHEHYPASPSLIKPDQKPGICNYGLYQLNRARNTWRANTERLTRADADWIRDRVCLACENHDRCVGEELKASFYTDEALLQEWLDAERVFSLREERLNL